MLSLDRISNSPVYLEPEQHIYIHKETGKYFNSVTGAIHAFEEPFNELEAIKMMDDKYRKFTQWFFNTPDYQSYDIIEVAKDYFEYKSSTFEDTILRHKISIKALKNYYRVFDLYRDIDKLKSKVKGLDVKIYLDEHGKFMANNEILEYWKTISNLATSYGSMVHLMLEYKIAQHFKVRESEDYIALIEEAWDLFLSWKEKMKKYAKNTSIWNVYEGFVCYKQIMADVQAKYEMFMPFLGEMCIPERIMCAEKYELCGTADKFIVPSMNGNIVHFGDHKTNNEFRFSHEYAQKLLPPFSSYDVCENTIYTMQLNVYANMTELEFEGCKVQDLWVSYWNKKTQTFTKYDLKRDRNIGDKILQIYYDKLSSMYEVCTKKGIFDGIDERYQKYLSGQIMKKVGFLASNGKSKAENQEYLMTYCQNFQNKQSKYVNNAK